MADLRPSQVDPLTAEEREWVARIDGLVRDRDAIQAQHDALRSALRGEVERLRSWRHEAADVTAPDNIADRLQAILKAAGEKREVPDYGEARDELKALIGVLSFASIDDVDIPDDWPSVTCQNPGHRQRHEDAGWICPDCLSTWWALDGSDSTAHHVLAFIRRLVAHLSSEQKGADR